MSKLNAITRMRLINMAAAAILFPVVLRGLISVLHPKEGELSQFADWLFGAIVKDWIIEFVSAPAYSFLTSKVWSIGPTFIGMWVIWMFIAFFFTVYKSEGRKYA